MDPLDSMEDSGIDSDPKTMHNSSSDSPQKVFYGGYTIL